MTVSDLDDTFGPVAILAAFCCHDSFLVAKIIVNDVASEKTNTYTFSKFISHYKGE